MPLPAPKAQALLYAPEASRCKDSALRLLPVPVLFLPLQAVLPV